MKQKSLKLNAALNLTKTIIGLIFPLITFPYASRVLMPVSLGKVNFAQSIVSYFALIASLGITNYGIREASKVRDDKLKLSQFSKELLIINLISTAIAYILFFISIFVVPKFSEYRALLCVCSGSILFTTLGMDWLYTAIEDFMYITIRSIIFQLISLVLLLIFVRNENDYLIYAGIAVVSSVGSNVMNFIHSKRIINFKDGSKLELKKHLKPIIVLFAMAVTIQIYTALDTTMLGFISGEWYVGIYTAATKINKVVLSAVVAVSTVILPRLSYYTSQNNTDEFNKLVYKGLDLILLFSIPATIGLCLLSEQIILVLSGRSFIEAITPMRIMNPIIIVIGLSNFMGVQIFMPLNKEKNTLYSVIAGAVTNFILNIILIPKFNALGASIATICAETIVTLVQFILARKIIDYRFVLMRSAIYIANSIVMAIPVFLCIFFIKIEWVALIVGIITGVGVYLIMLTVEKNQFVMNIFNSIKLKLKH